MDFSKSHLLLWNRVICKKYVSVINSFGNYPVSIYLLKLSNLNSRTLCENRFKVNNKGTRKMTSDPIDIVLVSLLLTLNRFHTFFCRFHYWLWTNNANWLITFNELHILITYSLFCCAIYLYCKISCCLLQFREIPPTSKHNILITDGIWSLSCSSHVSQTADFFPDYL